MGIAIAVAAAIGVSIKASETLRTAADVTPLTTVVPVRDGQLSVCADLPMKPFAFVADGAVRRVRGFDIELAESVADRLDLDLKVLDVPLEDIVTGRPFNDDECDMALSGITITGARARVVDFSSPYLSAYQTLVTRRGAGIAEIADLRGRRVGVQVNTTAATFMSDFSRGNTEIVALESTSAVLALVKSGNLDAAMVENSVASQFVTENPGFKVAKDFDLREQYGMAVKRDGNIPLLRVINNTLAEMQADGTFRRLYREYFG